MLTNVGGNARTGNMQFGRLIKLDFPKFIGDDVNGWIYRAHQFFKVDGIPDDQKVIGFHLSL